MVPVPIWVPKRIGWGDFQRGERGAVVAGDFEVATGKLRQKAVEESAPRSNTFIAAKKRNDNSHILIRKAERCG